MGGAGGSAFLRLECAPGAEVRRVPHRSGGKQCHRAAFSRLFSTYRDPDSANLLLMFRAAPFLTAGSLNMKTLAGRRRTSEPAAGHFQSPPMSQSPSRKFEAHQRGPAFPERAVQVRLGIDVKLMYNSQLCN